MALELCQEDFRSVGDANNLLSMAKKALRLAMVANYYEKLTRFLGQCAISRRRMGEVLYHDHLYQRQV